MLSAPELWTCPFCGRHATITDDRKETNWFQFEKGNRWGKVAVSWRANICPNPVCREHDLTVWVRRDEKTVPFPLIPPARIQVFPDYIPAPILNDYREACLVAALSPKASATLSRRCLQGMIRDFWKVRKNPLYKAIEAIKGKVDPTTWKAMDAVRKIGNIGAHMEKDINLIVDVDEGEAESLIGLVETLIKDWYVARHDREEMMAKIINTAEEKATAKKLPAVPDSGTESEV